MKNFIDQKLQEFDKKCITYIHNGGFMRSEHGLNGDLDQAAIESFLLSSLQSMQEETRREIKKEIEQMWQKPNNKGIISSEQHGFNEALYRVLSSLSSPKQEGEATKEKPEKCKDIDVPSKCYCHCHYGCEGIFYRNGVEVAHCKCMQIHCEHCTPEAEETESMKEEK